MSFRSGTLVNTIGFSWMLVGIAILCFCYAPLLILLRAPPTKEEKKVGGVGGVQVQMTATTVASVEGGIGGDDSGRSGRNDRAVVGVDNPAIVSDEHDQQPAANSITKF